MQRCNVCHGAAMNSMDAYGPFLTRDRVKGREDAVRRVIADGTERMPARLPLAATVQDVAGAFDFLANDPAVDAEHISVIGFGWGGWRAWRLAERTPSLHRAVVFYGTTSDDRRLDRIRAPVLGHYAGYDFQTTAQVLATKRRLGDRFTYHVYPDMDRGFAGGGSGAIDYVALVRGRDDGEAAVSAAGGPPAEVAAAVRLAWERTLAFFSQDSAP